MLSASCAAQVLPQRNSPAFAHSPHGPEIPPLPLPQQPPPAASIALVYDIFDNHWCLGKPDPLGNRPLLILPAQHTEAWVPDQLSKLPPAPYQWLRADDAGLLWAASSTVLLYLDPHHPEKGWKDATARLALNPHETITAVGNSPEYALAVALSSGTIVELSAPDKPPVRTQFPARADRLVSDAQGSLWIQAASQWWSRPPAATSWHRDWTLLARMPGGNHDLAGDTLDGNFYLAGGQTAGWGYPAAPHVFDAIYCLYGQNPHWTTPARLSHPRFYNGTTAFQHELWIIAGNRRDKDGVAHFLSTVEIFNPRTGLVRQGPPLPYPLEMPVSARIGSRIYVAGGTDPAILTATPGHTYHLPGRLLSIGAGEDTWRPEPDAPFPLPAIAGTALGDELYLAVPSIGLCAYHTGQKLWRSIPGPVKLRSPQITAFHGEIWLLGGRDSPDPLASYIYSPARDAWSTGPRLPRELAWGAAGVFHDTLIITGGADGRSYNNRTFAYTGAPSSRTDR